MTAIQGSLRGIPEELNLAIFKFLSPTDIETNALVSPHFQKMANDWHVWKDAAEALHIDVVATESVQTYRDAIDAYYKEVDDAFLHQLDIANKEMDGMDGYDFVALQKLMKSIPEYKEKGILSYAKYNEVLRQFIRENKTAEIFSLALYESVENIPLLKMFLEDGVQPPPVTKEFPQKSLGFVALISLKSDFPTNPDFCKLILNHYPIDAEGLSYLLWLVCHASDADSEAKQIEVMQLLLSKGATLDPQLIADYPPLADEEKPLTFTSDKPLILEFLRAHAAG